MSQIGSLNKHRTEILGTVDYFLTAVLFKNHSSIQRLSLKFALNFHCITECPLGLKSV